MRCYAFTVIAGVALLAAGCGTTVENDNTLEALESKIVIVEEESLPAASPQEAQRSYKELLDSTQNQQLRAKALERLADLQLETQQAATEQAVEKEIDQAFQPETSVTRQPETQESLPKSTRQFKEITAEKRKAGEKPARPKSAAEIPPPIPTGAGDKTMPPSDVDFNATSDYVQVAQQYEELLKRYPNSQDNERIYYQLARAYDLAGEIEKALDALTRLAKEFPDTKNIEEVQFRRGEILFSLKSYAKAVAAYRVVLNNRKSEFYERSLYKHGWSLFKLNKPDRALVSFYQLLDFKFDKGRDFDDLSRSEREVLEDTFRVISVTYSFKDGPKSIAEFSNKRGERSYEYLIYDKLGELYLDQERIEDAANTYLAFINRYPNASQSPEYYLKVVSIYQQGGYPKLLTQAKADFVSRYGVGKTYWAQQDKELLAKMSPHIKSNLKELAEHYHAIGQKTKKPEDYKTAAYWYREYVRSFPGEAQTAQMNFLLAEVLAESGDLAGAAVEYENTAYNYPEHDQSAEAGYAAILAHQKQLKGLKDQALSDQRRQAITSALNFADHFPQDQRVPPVLLKAAEEFTDLEQYKDASTVARRLTTINDEQRKAQKPVDPKLEKIEIKAWAILANAEFQLGNYKEAELATLNRLRAVDPKQDKDRKAHVERLAASIYKQGEAAKQANNLEEAADHFLRVASLAPTSSIRVTAEYDAAVTLAQTRNWDRAIPVLNRFAQLYPDHKYSKSIVETLAVGYEESGNLTNAAAVYAEIFKRETDPEKKRELVLQSAALYEKAGKQDSAMDVYKQYVQLYPKPVEEAVEAQLKLADYYKQKNDVGKRHYWLQQIIQADASGTSTERTQYLAAKASLELAEPMYTEYKAVQLVLPLKPNLKKKKELLEQTIDAYTKAANYGIQEVTTASTFRIAEIYNDFSKGLFNSQRPQGLSDTELEQYELLLEEQAYPFEEQAIEIHETNAARAFEGVYDEWVQKSFQALRKLRPIQYAKNERSDLLIGVIN
jgi:TolA-binding protein